MCYLRVNLTLCHTYCSSRPMYIYSTTPIENHDANVTWFRLPSQNKGFTYLLTYNSGGIIQNPPLLNYIWLIVHVHVYIYTAQLRWNYKKSTITKLHIWLIINIFRLFFGMSKYESSIYLCTLFDIQCCQSVIRKLLYTLCAGLTVLLIIL